ncbi:competence protein CoiA family protein [Rothia sp. ARF10]|nr:competence protein CoiA family protein [Rothia sp. ARF10]
MADDSGMGGPAHQPDALAAFQNGEERLVYARYKDRPDEQPYYLEDGTAREVRAWAKEHLECFMPECSARRLTTVARSNKRDGFSHMAGAGGHSKEGLFHQQAKALIARLVADRFGSEVTAVLEQATASRERRADVMLTWTNDRQVAVEIQYAALTPTAWRERHQSYVDQGIACVWLLGHLPPHLRARGVRATSPGSGGSGGCVSLGPLHQAMVEEGVPLFWINPIEESIGTVWTNAPAHECEEQFCGFDSNDRDFQVPLRPTPYPTDFGFFGADSIDTCSITPTGLETPTMTRLAASHAEYLIARKADYDAQAPIREARQRREAQARARQEAEDRAVSARRGRVQAEDDRISAWLAENHNTLVDVWEDSDPRSALVSAHGAPPAALATLLPTDVGVQGLPEHWHALLYVEHILRRETGSRFTVADCYRTLGAHGFRLHSDPTRRSLAIVIYLQQLATHDLIHIDRDKRRPARVDHCTVLGNFDTAAANKAQRQEQRAARAAEEAEKKRASMFARASRFQEQINREKRLRELRWQRRKEVEAQVKEEASKLQSAEAPVASSPQPAPAGFKHCRKCGGRLAEVLAQTGLHVGC